MARVPIRLRLALVFAVVMAIVLSGTGLFLYLQFRSDLDATVNQGLRSRAGDVTALLRTPDAQLAGRGRSPLTERGESFAQVLSPAGRLLDSTPTLRGRPVLTPAELHRASRRAVF